MSFRTPINLYRLWWSTSAGLLCACIAFASLATRQYDPSFLGFDPIILLVLIGLIAGAFFAAQALTLRHMTTTPGLLVAMIATGLTARVLLIPTEPLWEIDYFRYLWDGGVLWAGHDPYRWSPVDVTAGVAGQAITDLAAASGLVDQINYPHLRTIYPPLTQAVFALAHAMAPWSLMALKALYLLADGIALYLLIVILRTLNHPPIFASLYWLNPVVIQMGFNAAHMDIVLVPAMLGCVLLAINNQRHWAAVALAAATAIKLWPALLLPALLRFHPASMRQNLLMAVIFTGAAAFALSPQILGGLGEASGLEAFSQTWQRNVALFSLIQVLITEALESLGLYALEPGGLARVAVGGLIIAIIAISNRHPTTDSAVFIQRLALVPTALLLLGPAAYPWYLIWLAPLAALAPRAWPATILIIWGVTMPLYHLTFHPTFLEDPFWFSNGIVWIEHGPVIAALLIVFVRHTRQARGLV